MHAGLCTQQGDRLMQHRKHLSWPLPSPLQSDKVESTIPGVLCQLHTQLLEAIIQIIGAAVMLLGGLLQRNGI